MSKQTRPPGAQPRPQRPQPPSLRPPSSLDLARRQESHEVFVQIANLQMARARQQRIRDALANQMERCSREIDRIDAKVHHLYDQVGLRPADTPSDESESASEASSDDDSFHYEY